MFDYVASMTVGHTYNDYVAEVLREHGISCDVPELEIAKSKDDISRFTLSEKDIILDSGQVLEVKSRNLYFTEDPNTFPYNDLLVDTVSGFDAKEIKPMAYIFVSQKTKAIIALPTYTKESWAIQKKYDHERKHYDQFYLATIDLCRPLSALIKHLKAA